MALWTIIKSNLKKKKLNVISLFLLFFIISISVSVFLSSVINGHKSYDEALKNAALPDIVNYLDKGQGNEELIENLRLNKIVKEVETIDFILSKTVIHNEEDGNISGHIYVNDNKKHQYKMEDGTVIDAPKSGEVYLPYVLKKDFKAKVNDDIIFKVDGKEYTFKIGGFYEEPLCGSNSIGVKYFLVNLDDFNRIKNEININDAMKLMVNTFIKDEFKWENFNENLLKLNEETSIEKYGNYFRQESLREYTFTMTDMISAIFMGFIGLLFVIVILVIAQSIKTQIEMDYTYLGVYKSLGFTNIKLIWIFILQYLIIGLVGTVAGLIGGILGVDTIGKILLSNTGLLYKGGIRLLPCLGLFLVIMIVIILVTFIVTRNVTKISAVEAISLGRSPVYFKGRINFYLDRVTALPLSIKLPIKQIVTNIKQYIVLTLVISSLTFFIMSIFSIGDLLNEENISGVFNLVRSDITVYFERDEDKEVAEDIIKDVKDMTTVTKRFFIRGTYKAVDNMSMYVMVVDNSEEVLSKPVEGRLPNYKNEVMLNKKVCEILNKGIGDKIIIENETGAKKEYIVTGIHDSMSDMGKNVVISLEGIRELEDYKVPAIDLQIINRENTPEIVKTLKEKYAKYNDRINIVDRYTEEKKEMEDIYSTINLSITIVTVISIVTVILITILVCSQTFLKERIDLGILKSQGFTSKFLRFGFALRFLIVSLVGGIIGIVLNFVFNDMLMRLIFTNVGMSSFITEYSLFNVSVPVITLSLFTIMASYIISVKIKNVSPKDLIVE
ncbi:ABC transporter permease [Clostridium paraputrificum]|uniref:ABC transporter permease n=1 Tax=Clostridium paraputrificum TaxID=29363 RepID=UPI003D336EFB